MEEYKKTKMMSMLVLCCSAVTALCVGFVTYTILYGEMPYALKPLIEQYMEIPKKEKEKALVVAEIPYSAGTPDELFLIHFSDELKKKRAELSEKEEQLKRQEELLTEQVDLSKKLSAGVDKKQKAFEENIKAKKEALENQFIEKSKALESLKTEINNKTQNSLQSLAKTVETMQPKPAISLIEKMPRPLAAKIMFFMDVEKRAALLDVMLADKVYKNTTEAINAVNTRRAAREIVMELQKLTNPSLGGL